MHGLRVRNCSRLLPPCHAPLNDERMKEISGFGVKLSNWAVTDKNLDVRQIVGF